MTGSLRRAPPGRSLEVDLTVQPGDTGSAVSPKVVLVCLCRAGPGGTGSSGETQEARRLPSRPRAGVLACIGPLP